MRIYLRIYYACHEQVHYVYIIYLDTPVYITYYYLIFGRIYYICVAAFLACAYIAYLLRVFIACIRHYVRTYITRLLDMDIFVCRCTRDAETFYCTVQC